MAFQFECGAACLALQLRSHICTVLLFILCYLAWLYPWIQFLIMIYKYLFSLKSWRGVQSDFSQTLQSSMTPNIITTVRAVQAGAGGSVQQWACLLGIFNGDYLWARKTKAIFLAWVATFKIIWRLQPKFLNLFIYFSWHNLKNKMHPHTHENKGIEKKCYFFA